MSPNKCAIIQVHGRKDHSADSEVTDILNGMKIYCFAPRKEHPAS